MRFKAVIFDLDGTLLNTLEDVTDSANNVLIQNGYTKHSMENYKTFVGDGVKTLVKKFLPLEARSKKNIDKIELEFRKVYEGNHDRNTKLYSGIENMLNRLIWFIR